MAAQLTAFTLLVAWKIGVWPARLFGTQDMQRRELRANYVVFVCLRSSIPAGAREELVLVHELPAAASRLK